MTKRDLLQRTFAGTAVTAEGAGMLASGRAAWLLYYLGGAHGILGLVTDSVDNPTLYKRINARQTPNKNTRTNAIGAIVK